MSGKSMSVRRAKMELEFALLSGDKQQIAEAEKKLKEAIDERATKTKTRQSNPPREGTGNASR